MGLFYQNRLKTTAPLPKPVLKYNIRKHQLYYVGNETFLPREDTNNISESANISEMCLMKCKIINCNMILKEKCDMQKDFKRKM